MLVLHKIICLCCRILTSASGRRTLCVIKGFWSKSFLEIPQLFNPITFPISDWRMRIYDCYACPFWNRQPADPNPHILKLSESGNRTKLQIIQFMQKYEIEQNVVEFTTLASDLWIFLLTRDFRFDREVKLWVLALAGERKNRPLSLSYSII